MSTSFGFAQSTQHPTQQKPQAVPPIDFADPVNYPTTATPSYIVHGDFNNDGHIDLAVSHWGATRVTIHLNDGSGGFTLANVYLFQNGGLWGVDTGDFDGDGDLDLAVVDRYLSQIHIMLGNGDGSFTTNTSFPVNWDPRHIVTADFNNDTLLDLAVSSYDSSHLSLFRGVGNGTFTATASYPSTTPYMMRTSDFNNDGFLDIALTNVNNGTASIYMNNQNGTFANPVSYSLNAPAGEFAVGDLNGDGFEDLAVKTNPLGEIRFLLSTATGTFTLASQTLLPNAGAFIIIADMNNDGINDLVITGTPSNVSPPGTIQVYLAHGDLTFEPALSYTAGVNPSKATVADFNEDGLLDMATSNYGSDNITVVLSQPVIHSTYLPLIFYSSYMFPFVVNANAIPTRPVITKGEIYYTTTLTITGDIPSTGHFYFSSSPTEVQPVYVDDALVVSINGVRDSVWYLTDPQIMEVPRTKIEQWHNQQLTITFEDVYEGLVGSDPVWIIWVP